MTTEEPPARRLRLSPLDIEDMTKEQITEKWRAQDRYIDLLESKHTDGPMESEEKLKQQYSRREQVLVMRLTTKEHEMQEYLNQIQELKQVHNNSTTQLRSVLLDPAVNLMFQRLKKELEETKQKLEQTQNDLSAWKFTPDSQTGKRLMAKCRGLLLENDELGKVTSSGRIAKLEGSIALEKTLVQEMKKGQAEIDDFLVELDEDVEGMQSTIYILQQQLKEAREEILKLGTENQKLRTTAPQATENGRAAMVVEKEKFELIDPSPPKKRRSYNSDATPSPATSPDARTFIIGDVDTVEMTMEVDRMREELTVDEKEVEDGDKSPVL